MPAILVRPYRSPLLASLAPLCIAALLVSGCQQATDTPADAGTLQLSAEDVTTLRVGRMSGGPGIIGSIEPERQADLRAEVPSVILRVLRENGDQVKRGDILVQLDETAIRESLASAEAASRTASLTLEQAKRQLERQNTLRASGMTTAQSLEDAEARRNNAQSEYEAAKARLVSARQQLARTVVRAPFDGVVSNRKVSAGDTVQIGMELLKVIDPNSLRFAGQVSADQIGAVAPGTGVNFRVNGYGDQRFAGKVRRVNPVANAATRQVEVLVDFVGNEQPRLAGLYAEGQIESESGSALMLPAASLVREGDHAYAWVVRDDKLAKVELVLGERDARNGDFPVTAGLVAGDRVLRHPIGQLKAGMAVKPVATPSSGPGHQQDSKQDGAGR